MSSYDEQLNEDWKPEFGTIFLWPAMDKFGKIAVMVNNCWGDLPKALLSNPHSISLLDPFMEHIFEGLDMYSQYSYKKHGETILDLYSGLKYREYKNRKEIEKQVFEESKRENVISDEGLPAQKGLFVYYAVEGCTPGEDFVVGYKGKTKMGDYFRFLIPTVYASIDDFIKELRPAIAVSDTVDFTKDRLFDNDKISEYFPRMYS
ncbi:hypothetical protein BGI40_08795 [Snodgrassella communis]|uniref:hypothetical protein n=1 Tax=Snodgrassella communis TaxID=2946699 RepID=UPI0005625FA5